jgi:hypothetical protein
MANRGRDPRSQLSRVMSRGPTGSVGLFDAEMRAKRTCPGRGNQTKGVLTDGDLRREAVVVLDAAQDRQSDEPTGLGR